MLSLRMIIFAAIAGICLWGLFNLLDNLKQPGLLRTESSVAVKGCAALDTHKDSSRLCPQLLCQKALIDRKLLGLKDAIEIIDDTASGEERIIGIRATSSDQHLVCVVSGLVVKRAESVSAAQLDAVDKD